MATSNQQGMIAKTAGTRAVSNNKQPKTIKEYIGAMSGEIAKALPSVMTPERFTRIALSAVSNQPKLAECTPTSFLGALMNAAQLGLEPNTPLGQAYLIPYKGQCQFQIGYKGYIDLAYRSGEFKRIGAYIVYENDEFEYRLGLDADLKHVPARTNRGKPIYAYAVFQLVNGGYGFECMSIEDIRAYGRKYSKTFNNGPWQTDFEAMAKKTVLKQLLKFSPLKTEFARKINQDETIKTVIDSDMTDVENEFYDAEYEETVEQMDPLTGEIKNND